MSNSRVIHSSAGDVDEPEQGAALTRAATAGDLVDHRPAPPGRTDVVLELRRYLDPVASAERWAVVADFAGARTVIDFPAESAARREYEDTGDAIGSAIYMGRPELR